MDDETCNVFNYIASTFGERPALMGGLADPGMRCIGESCAADRCSQREVPKDDTAPPILTLEKPALRMEETATSPEPVMWPF